LEYVEDGTTDAPSISRPTSRFVPSVRGIGEQMMSILWIASWLHDQFPEEPETVMHDLREIDRIRFSYSIG
jgi:hypothetical protein